MTRPDASPTLVPATDPKTARAKLGEFCNIPTDAVVDVHFLAERLVGVAGAVSTIVRAHGQPELGDGRQPVSLSVGRHVFRSPLQANMPASGHGLAAYADASQAAWLQLQSPHPDAAVWASVMLPSDEMLRFYSQDWGMRAVGSFDARGDRPDITYPFRDVDPDPDDPAHTTYFNLTKELGGQLLILTG